MAEGYKDFTDGSRLYAAEIEEYAQNQAIMRFASASARDTALATVQSEGMFAYLKDTDTLSWYDGAAWRTAAQLGSGWTSSTGVVRFGGATTNVTSTFRYRRLLGTTIEWECEWILTGAPAAGSLTITTPVTPAAIGTNTGVIVGQALLLDSGTGRRTADVLQDIAAPTTFTLDTARTGYLALVSNAVPWTWAAPDEGVATGRYRAAIG